MIDLSDFCTLQCILQEIIISRFKNSVSTASTLMWREENSRVGQEGNLQWLAKIVPYISYFGGFLGTPESLKGGEV